jgi:hypothetical protein
LVEEQGGVGVLGIPVEIRAPVRGDRSDEVIVEDIAQSFDFLKVVFRKGGADPCESSGIDRSRLVHGRQWRRVRSGGGRTSLQDFLRRKNPATEAFLVRHGAKAVATAGAEMLFEAIGGRVLEREACAGRLRAPSFAEADGSGRVIRVQMHFEEGSAGGISRHGSGSEGDGRHDVVGNTGSRRFRQPINSPVLFA